MPKRHPTLRCAWLVLFRPTNANAGWGLQPRSKRLQGLIAFEREWRGYKPLHASGEYSIKPGVLSLSYCFVKQLKQFYSNYTDN
ncbi:MAG: hypothetical protein D0531_11940 [Methylococcales bacterium]|nr:MAG: hypothetical protein D0531_11940 [Methylococcales bacterium]